MTNEYMAKTKSDFEERLWLRFWRGQNSLEPVQSAKRTGFALYAYRLRLEEALSIGRVFLGAPILDKPRLAERQRQQANRPLGAAGIGQVG